MKVVSKLLAAFVLICAIYFVSGAGKVFADIEPLLEEGSGCSGNTCERCVCQYRNCTNPTNNPTSCQDRFNYCVNGDTSCQH